MTKYQTRIDIVVLIAFLFLATIYAHLAKNLFIGKAFLVMSTFTVLPALYLGIRRKKEWKKIIYATLVFGMLFGFGFEFIMEYNRAYTVLSSVFPFKLFGFLPPDNVLGHMMMTFITIMFYQHFIKEKTTSTISKRFPIIVSLALGAIGLELLVFLSNPDILRFPYPYFFMGLLAIVVPVKLALARPQFVKDISLMAIFFFCLYFVTEVAIAVPLGWWVYNGNNYIGWVKILSTTFPFEELFFWMICYAPTLVAFYEVFIEPHNARRLS